MDKYEVLAQIGDGTFGSVAKAVSKKTGQLVAIKKMKQKFYTWEECVKLPEVDVVRRLHRHPNIVKLSEVIRENNELFFVFEYMDGDLLGVIKKSKQAQRQEDTATAPAIPYPKIKHYMRQILQSLAYLHKRGYFHRDLKPENLLIRKEVGDKSGGAAGSGSGCGRDGDEVVKLADFGLVKEIRARPPFTDYVSTRWYRAPELLLQDRAYNAPVDIFAAACIMSELITTRPLFPGSNEVDQLFKIMSVLGSPTEKTWPGGFALARKIRYTFPSVHGSGLAKVLPSHVPAAALDLMQQMLQYDPKQRPTAEQCLAHPYFNVGVDESHQKAAVPPRMNAGNLFEASPQSAPTGPSDTSGGAGSGGGSQSDAKRFLTAQQLPSSMAYPSSVSLAGGNHPGASNPAAVSPQKFYMLPTSLGVVNSMHNNTSTNNTSSNTDGPSPPTLELGKLGMPGGISAAYNSNSPYKKSASPMLYGQKAQGSSPKQSVRYPLLQNSLKNPSNSPSKSGSTCSPSPVALARMLAGGRGSIQLNNPAALPTGTTGGGTVGGRTSPTTKDPLGVNLEDLLQEFSNELNGQLGISAQTVKEYSSPTKAGARSSISTNSSTAGVGKGAASGGVATHTDVSPTKAGTTTAGENTSRKPSLHHVNLSMPEGTTTTTSTSTSTGGGGVGVVSSLGTSKSVEEKSGAEAQHSSSGGTAKEGKGDGGGGGGGGGASGKAPSTTSSPTSSSILQLLGKDKGLTGGTGGVGSLAGLKKSSNSSPFGNPTTTTLSPSAALTAGLSGSTPGVGIGTTSLNPVDIKSSPRPDPIAALLQHSRYKSSSFQGTSGLSSSNQAVPAGKGMAGGGLLDGKEKGPNTNSPNWGTASKVLLGGKSIPFGDRSGESSGRSGLGNMPGGSGGGAGKGNTMGGGTSTQGGTSSVSPSIRALLARRQQNLAGIGGSTSGKKSPTIMGFT